jgi:hypothetical protein
MAIKSTTVKNFIKDTGTRNQLFVFVGSDVKNNVSNTNQSSLDLWKQSDFSVRVGQNSIFPVVPNIKWIQKRPYIPWSGTVENSGNYYVYNDQNNYVYLCISDNENNRTDLRGENVSNIRPTHTSGIQSYSDGYSWKPLYRITPSIERFITSKWIPVISFELYDSDNQKTQLEQTQEFCSDSTTTTTGQCAIYAKIPLSTDDDDGTIEYEKGDLFSIADSITCSDCHYLMKNNEKFVSVFYEDTETVANTIVIDDEYTKIGNLISQNQISTASPYYYLYQTNTNDNVEEGSIISAFIDLSDFTESQLIVSQENPELTITSNSGSDGRIRLKTGLINSSHVIRGIEILNRGYGYNDITLSINSGILSNSINSTSLLSAISVNLDTIDGLAFDPISVLNAQHVMIDARLDKVSIENSGILLPSTVNFFGLIENPVGISGASTVPSGSNLNKKNDYIFRTTAKVEVLNNSSTSQLPESSEEYDVAYIDNGQTTKNIQTIIGGTTVVSGPSFISYNELKNINYLKIDELIGGVLDGPTNGSAKTNSTIISILDRPNFVQYTGKVLSTTKLETDLPVADVESVIVRINIVKGL